MRKLSGGVLIAMLAAMPATAQEMDGWSGEGSVSAAITSGNTDTKDIGIGLKIANRNDGWRTSGAFTYDFGDNSGVESRNRWSLAGQVDRDITPRLYGYVRGAYEEDKFSGFDSRLFLGGGLGFKIIATDATSWKVEGGPGYRRDVFRGTGISSDDIGARAASNFAHKFNDAVTFTNDTEWTYSDVSSQLVNITALTAKLTDALAARASFEVRNESDPPFGRKATDTITRLSVVYGF